MKELTLDGAGWSTKDDVYSAFFHVVGAPEWHGRNFDALRDSILGGSINRVELPYPLVIRNYDRIGVAAKEMADDFVDVIHELAAEGCAVQHRLDELEAEFDRSLISALKECASGRWGLVAASGVVFTVQDLHKKMMRVKNTECNQFHNFWLSVGENIGCVKLVGRGTFAQEVFMVTLTLIGLLLSLAQVVISPRRK